MAIKNKDLKSSLSQYIITLCLVTICGVSEAQILFNNTFDTLVDYPYPVGNGSRFSYGSGVSFFDINEDGFDDITLVPPKDSFLIVNENQGGFFVTRYTDIPIVGLAKAIQWFDYDNDGDNDMLIAYEDSNLQLFRHDTNYQFTNVTTSAGVNVVSSTYYGITTGDLDNNGFLDVYVSNYDNQDPNVFFYNDAGAFSEMSVYAGLENGLKHSFQSIMYDFNHDSLLDIYLSNDLEDTNELYINNGDSTFTALGTSIPMVVVMDGMGVSPTDFNDDGFIDLFIANTDFDNRFYVSDSMLSHTNEAETQSIDSVRVSWGSDFFDADLDRDEDFYMANGATFHLAPFSPDKFFENVDGHLMDITEAANMIGQPEPSFSTALGDLDANGLPDLLVFRSIPGKPRLYQNTTTTSNKWIKVFLEGVSSNRNAVGSTVSTYIDGVKKSHWRFSSESYLGQNSQHLNISLGDTCGVDSMIIQWPNGEDTVLYNLECSQHIHLKQGADPYPIAKILLPDGPIICGNGFIRLVNPDPGHSVVWSTGSTADTLFVYNPGTYSFTAENQFGNSAISKIVTITAKSLPEFQIQDIKPSCYGNENGSMEVIPTNNQLEYKFKWSNGSPNAKIVDLGIGTYSVTVQDEFGCKDFGTEELTQPDSLDISETHTDVQCFGDKSGNVTIDAQGGTFPYTYVWSNATFANPLSGVNGGTYTVTVSDVRNCSKSLKVKLKEPTAFVADSSSTRTSTNPPKWRLNVTAEGGIKPYGFFSTHAPDTISIGIWQGVDTGTHIITAVDANGCDTQFVFHLTVGADTDSINSVSRLNSTNQQDYWYPNPSQGDILWNGNKTPDRVVVYAPDGRLLQDCTACSHLSFYHMEYKGVVVIHTMDNGVISVQRLVLLD